MGFFTEVVVVVGAAEGRPPPPSSVSTTLVESWVRGESAEQREGNGGGGRRTQNLSLALEFSGGISVPVFPRGRAKSAPKTPPRRRPVT